MKNYSVNIPSKATDSVPQVTMTPEYVWFNKAVDGFFLISLVKSFELIEFCQLKNIANGIELEYGDVIITKDMLRSITKVNI